MVGYGMRGVGSNGLPVLFFGLFALMSFAADDKPLSTSLLLEGSGSFSFSTDDLTLLDPLVTTATAWLGLGIQDMDLLQSALETKGVRIADVAPEAPAHRGGVRKGDILTHWNETPITSTLTLQDKLAVLSIDDAVTVKVFRKGVSQTIKLKATDRETYRWKDFWEPNLPNFKASEDLDELFDEQADSLDALTREFEALQAEEASKDKKAITPKSKS